MPVVGEGDGGENSAPIGLVVSIDITREYQIWLSLRVFSFLLKFLRVFWIVIAYLTILLW